MTGKLLLASCIAICALVFTCLLSCRANGKSPPTVLATTLPFAKRPATAAFVHPGGLHTLADLERMKAKVAARQHPWIDGWNLLIADPKAQSNYRAAPKPNMGVSRQRAQDDATAAYLNAMRWYISGDPSFADCAVRNLNGWAATVNQIPAGRDQPGLGGIPIGTFALAAEVLRMYSGWTEADQAKFKTMLLTYFYPACDDFLKNHNGGNHSRYWANWDAANMLAITAIGVFCDDRDKFDQGIDYFKTGQGMGSIKHAVPFLYANGLGQWQESGRDHAHSLGGMGLVAETCQVTWNQGVDLFGFDNNRLLAGAEYEAQYTQWKGVPYTFYTNQDNANQYWIAPGYHGRLGNCEFYELLYNHYVIRRGLSAPNVKRFAELLRPEHGNADILGYGTLTFTLDSAASPYPASPIPPVPQDLTATVGIGRIDLQWSPSGAYSTQGYRVLRAVTLNGPFESVYSTTSNTVPQFTDSKITNGTTYYYTVSALNQSGESEHGAVVSASPLVAGELPKDWMQADIGNPSVAGSAAYAGANQSIVVVGEGAGIGDTADHCHFVYQTVSGDFTITARLVGNTGRLDKAGLMMRENNQSGSVAVALTKGELGGRQARFRTRATKDTATTVQFGNDYAATPIWFRLQRTGTKVTASHSFDRFNWFTVGTSTVNLGQSYLVGMATSSGSTKGELSTTYFDNVRMETVPPPAPEAPGKLVSTAAGSTIRLAWSNSASTQDGFKIESSSDNVNFYEIADLGPGASSFENTGLSDLTYYYRAYAYNTGGRSADSNVTSARPIP